MSNRTFVLCAAAAVTAGAFVLRAPAQAPAVVKHLGLTAEQKEILGHMSIVDLPDGAGGTTKTLRITGINVQVVNGLGATATTNGLGNLIVGYQELGNEVEADARTGSHYVVVGREHNYKSFGGIVAGESNIVENEFASAAGGRRNRANGRWSAITGGGHNYTAGDDAVVVGGTFNLALSGDSVVVGGAGNRAEAAGAGGAGAKAVVVGGYDNQSKGQGSVVVGGRYNTTTANYSAILAGTSNSCIGDPQGNGSFCAIVGGEGNSTTPTHAAVVSGGSARTASGPHDWVAGGLLEDL
ncbi:MAG: hypothetical protein ACF8XB_18045 [Planctomycetota bacterium JB042]